MSKWYGEFLRVEDRKPAGSEYRVVHAAWCRFTRCGTLLKPVIFRDSSFLEWEVPAGFEFNGLSVRRLFWQLTPPYQSKAREASVVHDWLCMARPCSSVEAHRIFYEAMRANGVGAWTAWTRWLAVRLFGPRWNDKRPILVK